MTPASKSQRMIHASKGSRAVDSALVGGEGVAVLVQEAFTHSKAALAFANRPAGTSSSRSRTSCVEFSLVISVDGWDISWCSGGLHELHDGSTPVLD